MTRFEGVAFAGPMFAGKTTAARIACQIAKAARWNPRIVLFAEPLKKAGAILKNGKLDKSIPAERMYLQRVADLAKETWGNLHFTDMMREKILDWLNNDDRNVVVVDDLRFTHEAQMLSSIGIPIIYIDVPDEIRARRGNLVNTNHPSERTRDILPFAGYLIENVGTMEELENDVRRAIYGLSASVQRQP